MNIPPGKCVGFEISGSEYRYKVISQHWIDDDLSVYEVRHNDETFEAQQFMQSPLPLKLYLSRKRRKQRLRWSGNFVEEISLDGATVFISHLPQGGIGRHENRRQVEGAAGGSEIHCAISEKNYPMLGSTDWVLPRPQCGAWSGKTSGSFAQVAATADAQKSQVTNPPNKSAHERGRKALQPLANSGR